MEIQAIGIMGANAAGCAMAEVFLKNGFQVRVYNDSKDGLDVSLAKISWSLRQAGTDKLLANIEGIQDLSKFAGADIVIEADSKSAEERKIYFSKLRQYLGERCVLAAGCSVHPLKEAMEYSDFPKERTLGFHFMTPVRTNPLVELVRTDQTGDEYITAAADLLRKIGKTPVIVKDNPGQIVERLARPFVLAAFKLLESGRGSPHDIDGAFREVAQAPAGPFEMVDSAGLDADYDASQAIYAALGKPERLAPSATQLRLVQYGQLGRKAMRGFYIYEDGLIVGENPILPNIVKYLGLKKTPKEDIFAEIMRPVVEEAKILASEIMASEYDIETAMKLAFGWPKGPFAFSRDMAHLLERKKTSEFDKLDTY